MLYFIGIGISGYGSLPLDSINIIKKSRFVYLEQFTSPINVITINNIKKLSPNIILTKRWFIEDGNEILERAKHDNVTILTYGDPYIATTHYDLRIRANKEKIITKTIHASSSITAIVGECGLHYYKIGRVATITNELKMMMTPYNVIYKNMIENNHSVLLLEFNHEKNFFLDPKIALKNLLKIEKVQKMDIINESTYAIVASRVGLDNQNIIAGKISNLLKINFNEPPHTIIIIGNLHFTEYDAIKNLLTCVDPPQSNSDKIQTTTERLLNKYVPKLNIVTKQLKLHYNEKKLLNIIENAESYAKDAENFFSDGHNEIAMLSIGYAEGLIDALMAIHNNVKLKRFD